MHDSETAMDFLFFIRSICICFITGCINNIINLFKYIDKISFCVILFSINLRGKVKILTGGKARDPHRIIRKQRNGG